MAWNNLAVNQPVNGVNLLDAVSQNLFTVRSGQTIPNNNECLTKDEAFALLNIQEISGNRLVQKQQFVSAVVNGFPALFSASYESNSGICTKPLDTTLYFPVNPIGADSPLGLRAFKDIGMNLPADLGWSLMGPGQFTGPFKWCYIDREFESVFIFSKITLVIDTNCPP